MKFLGILLFGLLVPGRVAAQSFPTLADAVFSSAPFQNTTVSVLFVSLPDGTTFYSKNPSLALPPASLAKLATSAAALEYLKPEFRFKTSFLIKKTEKDKPSISTLIWRGSGDPSISGRDRSHLTEIFEIWGSSLAARGIRKIGRLILDNRYFEGPATIASWPPNELSYWYTAETSAISFNDNCVGLSFYPGPKVGRKAKVIMTPDFGYITPLNQSVTGPAGSPFTLDYRRDPETNRVTFFGSIDVRSPIRSDFVSVHEPALFAADTLQRVWKTEGPKIAHSALYWENSGLKEDQLMEIFNWPSTPLSRLVKTINANSQNLYAEQTLKTMGKEIEGHGSFNAGLTVIERFLTHVGLSTADYHLVDGSGLSEDNRFSASGLVKILKFMNTSPLFKIYFDSLGVPGIDHSVRHRMNKAPSALRMRLKTGTVADARNLAGFFESKNGRLYAFAILVNGPKLDRHAIDTSLDRLCEGAAELLP